MINRILSSREETLQWGEWIGKILNPGDVIFLRGKMGIGKTTITSGIAKGLGIKEYVSSPTFTIVCQYDGRHTLYHFDMYRVSDSDELMEIGFEEYLDGTAVVIIEWAELVQDILPKEFIYIELNFTESQEIDSRNIKIGFEGMKYQEFEEKLLKMEDSRI